MAKRQFRKITVRRQQLLLKYSTVCVLVLMLLMARLDSSGAEVVNALSIPLNGNGNRLQQQDDNLLAAAQQQNEQLQRQHVDTVGEAEEVHNYVEPKSETELDPTIKKYTNGLGEELTGSQLILGHPFKTLKLIKRAPGGFVGMRGKKDTFTNVNLENDQDFVDDEAYEQQVFPQPWQQLANNMNDNADASDDDDANDLINWNEYSTANAMRYKKAPNTFYGVRGKKYTPIAGVNPSGGETMRWNQFLQKLDEDRMRNMIMENVMDTILENFEGEKNEESTQNDITKRAPTGFTGVRGKRPAMGIVDDMSSMESASKRALGNSFVGVRGKKDVSHQAFKRSPLGGGSSAMGGLGGKRQRFTDFGNKFVAVRGKKSFLPHYNEEQWQPRNEWMRYNEDNFRRSPAETTLSSSLLTSAGRGQGMNAGSSINLLYDSSNKRAPSGFQGMRGKRPAIADNLLATN